MALLESDLQEAIISWAGTMDAKYPCLEWLFHPANGGFRSGRESISLKKQGVVPGILDLMLCVPRGGYHGIAIELKRPFCKCAKPSKEQSSYIDFLTEQGYYCFVSNDFEEVKSRIVKYLDNQVIHRGVQG